ncbi:hypothetical protein B0H34DRAFT_8148 [Crassisporium funariophilum]|nr:hypothetical protein B0H34DRAFT_8148 [Crassisporium funariophilum]
MQSSSVLRYCRNVCSGATYSATPTPLATEHTRAVACVVTRHSGYVIDALRGMEWKEVLVDKIKGRIGSYRRLERNVSPHGRGYRLLELERLRERSQSRLIAVLYASMFCFEDSWHWGVGTPSALFRLLRASSLYIDNAPFKNTTLDSAACFDKHSDTSHQAPLVFLSLAFHFLLYRITLFSSSSATVLSESSASPNLFRRVSL